MPKTSIRTAITEPTSKIAVWALANAILNSSSTMLFLFLVYLVWCLRPSCFSRIKSKASRQNANWL
ncbi:MAG: hypothetical protein ACOX1A_03070 [Saccharofermentanales bacterium]